ncbi:MAG: YlmH/Sll1252 family protein [Eubacteriales bacterium]
MKNYTSYQILKKKVNHQVEHLEDGVLFFDFIDPVQQKMIGRELAAHQKIRYAFFGGHHLCERKMLCVYTSSFKKDIQWPMSAILFIMDTSVNHRIILGAVMSLGLTRETIGDIIILDNTVQIVMKEHTAQFIQTSLRSIKGRNITPEIIPVEQLVIPQQQFNEEIIIVNSYRLDGFISSSFGVSRKTAVELIKKGYVKINHEIKTKSSCTASISDLISVRGKGRFILYAFLGNSKKDKNKILIRKYL